MYRADLLAEVVPGAMLVACAFVAALPAFRLLRMSASGRARSAVAWIFGFLAGLAAAVLLSITIGEGADPNASVGASGLLGSFLGPFIGIVHAKLAGPVRKRRRMPDLSDGAFR
jgi:hypothetical protein